MKLVGLIRRFIHLFGNNLYVKFFTSTIFVKFFIILSLLAHWGACAWRLCGDTYVQESTSLFRIPDLPSIAGEEQGWASCEPGGPCEPGIYGRAWMLRYGLEDRGVAWAQYEEYKSSVISYIYFRPVLGCVDADLCNY